MIRAGSKFWFSVTLLAGFGVVLYWLGSDGERFGTTILCSLVLASAVLGLLFTAVGDGDVFPGAEDELAFDPIRRPAFWPALAALGAGTTVVGLATGGVLLYAGWVFIAVAVVEWTVETWAERSTADPGYNEALRNHIMRPFEFPGLAVVIGAIAVISFSRVLLALPEAGSSIIAIVASAAVLGVAALLATRPRVSSSAVALALVIGSVLLIGGGIISGVVGHREIEHHESSSHDTSSAPTDPTAPGASQP